MNQNTFGSWNVGGASQESDSRFGSSSSNLSSQRLYPSYYDNNSYSSPSLLEEEPPKRRNRSGRRAALVAGMLVLSLIGGAVGGGATSWWMSTQLAPHDVAASQSEAEAQPQVAPAPSVPAVLPQAAAGGDITSVVEKAGPSVVEIRLSSRVMTFFGEQQSNSAGSGVIYSQDGYIITNNHVIENASEVMVRTQDGSEYPATLVGADPKTDLAVIKIEAEGLTPVTFADSDTVQVGQVAVAIGNPLGTLGGSVTNGVVSAKDREITIGNETMTLMQTSAAINPGNSGGGLFDSNGNLIGIVNAKSSGLDIEGLGFAIPSNTALAVTRDLIEYGYVTGRPELGIKVLQVADLRTANYYGLREFGVYVMETTRNNGLMPGDRIVSINGKAIETASHVSEAVISGKVGDVLNFVIVRDGKTMDLEVQILEQIPEALKKEVSLPTGGI
ncbi:MAG: S1C family serine protease [Oscillospiraceae bacterium]|jgi:serine protease Do